MIFAMTALALVAVSDASAAEVETRPDYVTQPVWRGQPTPQDLAGHYPVKAAKAPGRAVVECIADVAGALTHCRAIYETPGGLGFGEAAAALVSGKFSLEPQDRAGRDVAGRPIRIPIRWTQEIADPQPPRLTIGSPEWADRPSSIRMRSSLPRAAWREKVGGGATIACKLTEDGRLADCVVEKEEPSSLGFGEAALKLSSKFRMDLTAPAFAPGKSVYVALYWDPPIRKTRGDLYRGGPMSPHPSPPRVTIPPGTRR